MKTSDLGQLLPRYFTEHLVGQRDLSAKTVAAFRATFRLFLRFLCRKRRTSPSMLPLSTLNADAFLAFLGHLEAEWRSSPRSRNARLAAIRPFVGYLSDLLGSTLPDPTRRVLTIRSKRHNRRLVGFITRPEITALFRAMDESWTGEEITCCFSSCTTQARESRKSPVCEFGMSGWAIAAKSYSTTKEVRNARFLFGRKLA